MCCLDKNPAYIAKLTRICFVDQSLKQSKSKYAEFYFTEEVILTIKNVFVLKAWVCLIVRWVYFH